MAGVLSGIKVIEVASIGPGPFAAMMLSDMGADVIRVDRASSVPKGTDAGDFVKYDLLNRGRRSIGIDLKKKEGLDILLALASQADVLMEGFRPGVAEKLGFGPEEVRKTNKKLVYGRMTGWGQSGPMSNLAGHDINYISLTGALSSIGRRGDNPVPPLNLVGDFGGGGLLLAFGIVCALLEAQRSGEGQVVDAAMVDGASILMTMIYGFKKMNLWQNERGTNLLDTGAHFYEVYKTKDSKYMAVGAIEPQFYSELLSRLSLDNDHELKVQMSRQNWPKFKQRLAEKFSEKTREEWEEIFANCDACVSPVLDLDEAPQYEHNVARETFVDFEGIIQPAPAPRFSRTPCSLKKGPAIPGDSTDEILNELGLSAGEIDALKNSGAVA